MSVSVDDPVVERHLEAAAPAPVVARTRGRRRTVLLALVAMPVWALVCAGVLEAPLHSSRVGPVLAPVAAVDKPLDVLFLWLVLVLLWCVTGRLWASMGILLGLTATLSAVNAAKMEILTEPLYPSDYQFLGSTSFLLEMVSPTSVVAAVLGLVLLAVGTVAAGRFMGRRYPRVRRTEDPRGWARLLGVRVLVGAVTTVILASALQFNEPGNLWRRAFDAQGAVWQPFLQARNYQTNGFIGGALYNLPTEPMEMPADYSAGTMREIASRYAGEAAERNAGLAPGAMDDVNVVLVLSEAFADLSRLDLVDMPRDTMPLTRETMTETWSGNTLANLYATGTSSMEFQALTGQTIGLFKPFVSSPYQNFMTRLRDYPSAVGWFTERGHVPVAVHPYHADMYQRDKIYPMLGFDEFVHDGSPTDWDRLEDSKYISDEAAFTEVREQIRDNDDPLLVNLVTMQNHIPAGDWYADPVDVDAPGDPTLIREMGGYARGQEYTDAALRDFLDELAAGDEPTVVVFYGDHYPGVLTDEVFLANPGLGNLETPMFIWSSEGQDARELPLTSPSQFLPYVFDLVGEPLPPYYQLLTDVAEQIGVVGRGRIVTPDGEEVTEAELTPEQQRLLEDYRLVQYDFSIGERYAVDEMWYSFD